MLTPTKRRLVFCAQVVEFGTVGRDDYCLHRTRRGRRCILICYKHGSSVCGSLQMSFHNWNLELEVEDFPSSEHILVEDYQAVNECHNNGQTWLPEEFKLSLLLSKQVI